MLICKCCGGEAKWCGDGTTLDMEPHDCSHIHCENCGMHYSLEGNAEQMKAETMEELRAIMLKAYNMQGKGLATTDSDKGE